MQLEAEKRFESESQFWFNQTKSKALYFKMYRPWVKSHPPTWKCTFLKKLQLWVLLASLNIENLNIENVEVEKLISRIWRKEEESISQNGWKAKRHKQNYETDYFYVAAVIGLILVIALQFPSSVFLLVNRTQLLCRHNGDTGRTRGEDRWVYNLLLHIRRGHMADRTPGLLQ